MNTLSSIVKKSEFVPTIVGKLIDYTSSSGRDGMLVEDLRTGQLITITQGKAPTENAAAQRNTIETFKNPQSKKYLQKGAVFCFDNVKIIDKTGECTFINDIYSGESDQARTFAFLMARPLPNRKNTGYAHLEAMLIDKKKVVSTERDFVISVIESYSEILSYENAIGIKQCNKPLIYLTDSPTTKPIAIYLRDIQLEEGGYRRPKINELKTQLLNNDVFNQVVEGFRSATKNGTGLTVNVIPGLRIYVTEKTVNGSKYQNALKHHSAVFKVNVNGETQDENEIGYRNSIVGFWNGTVNSIRSIDQTDVVLNDYPESKAVGRFGEDKAKVSSTRYSASNAADKAASAFDNFDSAASIDSDKAAATEISLPESKQETFEKPIQFENIENNPNPNANANANQNSNVSTGFNQKIVNETSFVDSDSQEEISLDAFLGQLDEDPKNYGEDEYHITSEDEEEPEDNPFMNFQN